MTTQYQRAKTQAKIELVLADIRRLEARGLGWVGAANDALCQKLSFYAWEGQCLVPLPEPAARSFQLSYIQNRDTSGASFRTHRRRKPASPSADPSIGV